MSDDAARVYRLLAQWGMPSGQPAPLLGRHAELAAIELVIGGVRERTSRLLVLGDPGIGKTSLLDYGQELAVTAGLAVAAAKPSWADQRLPFAVLTDLFANLDSRGLPDQQRRVLDVAFGRGDDIEAPVPTGRLGAAIVEQIKRHTRLVGPLVVVIDDLQWVDQASLEPLEFALRRLPTSGVCVLMAARSRDLDDVTTRRLVDIDEVVKVRGLGTDDTAAVVRRSLKAPITPHLLSRIVSTVDGNPMYALEFARSADTSAGRPGEPLAMPSSLGDITAERVLSLPELTREALGCASILARPTTDAIAQLGLLDALLPAELAGVITVRDRRIIFAHPILASAAYEACTGTQRIGLHARSAVVTSGTEQLIHRALGSTGPDADLAVELVAAAQRELSRGAPQEAADIGALAISVTPDDAHDRPRHAVTVAELAFRAGRTEDAYDLVRSAHDSSPDPTVRASALLVWATIEFTRSADPEVAVGLARACLEVASDVPTRVQAHSILARCEHLDFEVALHHANAALALLHEHPNPDPALLAAALTAAAATKFNAGQGVDRVGLERAIELERDTDVIGSDSAFGTLAALLKYADDVETAAEMFETLANDSDPATVPYALGHLPQLYLWSGDTARAEKAASRHRALADEMQQESQLEAANFNLALLAAFRGELETGSTVGDELRLRGLRVGAPWTERMGCALLGFTAMCRDEIDEAVKFLRRYDDLGEEIRLYEPGYNRFVGDYIECLVAAGDVARAATVIERIEERSNRVHRASGLAAASRGRALMALRTGDVDLAVLAAERGVSVLDTTSLAYDRARSLLVLGVVARKARARARAREALDEALTIFLGMGAPHFARQAALERDRISGRSPSPTSSLGALTATEYSVAVAASSGRTNREIAAALHMSPKTVEAHLTRVYRKLGVTNRVLLAAALSSAGDRLEF